MNANRRYNILLHLLSCIIYCQMLLMPVQEGVVPRQAYITLGACASAMAAGAPSIVDELSVKFVAG